MFFRDYEREKAAESRHNETIGYLIVIVGSVFLVGGILETIITIDNPNWLLFFPYQLTSHPYSLLGLSFSLMGLVLLVSGMVLSLKYALERSRYMRELEESRKIEEERLQKQAQNQTLNQRILEIHHPQTNTITRDKLHLPSTKSTELNTTSSRKTLKTEELEEA